MFKGFKPQLAPNEQPDLNTINYPMLASMKLDGIRAIFKDGELYSRSLKILPNIHLHTKFNNLKEYSKRNNVILDGELYCTSVSFNELSGIIRSDDKELPYDLEFWCFDCLSEENKYFGARIKDYEWIRQEGLHPVTQKEVNSAYEVNACFEYALKQGFEGLILRNPTGYYKFGRCRSKANEMYKVKPFITYDSKIIGITQATEAREGSEKKINELGRSTTSQKKEDRIPVNKAAGFIVNYKGKPLEVGLAKHTKEMREDIWKNKDNYIGKVIEYRCMEVGMNVDGLPRHANFVRYREDK